MDKEPRTKQLQAAIDNAKRTYKVDIQEEIKRIKEAINIKENKYPAFWLGIRKDFNKSNINYDLICPMNSIYNMKFDKFKSPDSTLPMEYFFKSFKPDVNRKMAKKVEYLIEKYSIELYDYNVDSEDDYFILRNDFDELIDDIRMMSMPSKYTDIFAWLINRAFMIGSGVRGNIGVMQSNINKNRSLLLKVLYEVNPSALLYCFSGKEGTPIKNETVVTPDSSTD